MDKDTRPVQKQESASSNAPGRAPGRAPLTARLPAPAKSTVQRKAEPEPASPPVQRRAAAWNSSSMIDAALRGTAPVQAHRGAGAHDPASVQQAASVGVSGSGGALPHMDAIQQSFGAGHDLGGVKAHIGGAAAQASDAIGASAYATGSDVAFKSSPDLHTAAHEAAHVVQQQQGVQLAGGVGKSGDAYEQHADAVADRVVQGESASDLLASGPGGGGHSAVQGDWLGAGLGALGGAAAGAGIGAMVGGPLGAAVGGVIGGVAGAVGGHFTEEAVSGDEVSSEEQEATAEERQAGADIPAELRTRLFERLQGSSEIQAVLEEIRQARGDLNFPIKWSSRGNYHSSGSIHLDLNRDEESWVASLAHELVHLSTYVRGEAADVNENTRDEFVRLKMEDEINSQATQYVALLQMGNTTARSAGYQDFRSHLQSDHAELLTNESWSEIKEIAKEWLEDKYRNEWGTSNTGENYYEYWGNYWDRNHGG